MTNYSTSTDVGGDSGGDFGGGGMEEGEDDIKKIVKEIRNIIREVLLESDDDSQVTEMTKVGQAESMYGSYDLYVGYSNDSVGTTFKKVYNVVRSGDPNPASGYFDPSFILNAKKLPMNSFDGIS